MEEKLLEGHATPNLESLHQVRLTALMKEGRVIEEGRRRPSSWGSTTRPWPQRSTLGF